VLARANAQLAWATSGTGRPLRSPTVFEDVAKKFLRRESPLSCAGKVSGQLFHYNQGMHRPLDLSGLPIKGDQVRPPKDDR
jgi:hypothetical protein